MNKDHQMILQRFKQYFHNWKNRNIVLYGLGINTEMILENLPDYRVIGLMDGKRTDGSIFGKNIITFQQALDLKAELIIITSLINHVPVIYNRIESLSLKHSIPIYYMDGTNLIEFFDVGKELHAEDPYFTLNEAQLRYKIDQHQVISFDVMDTLLMRKTLYADDRYTIIQHRLDRNNIQLPNFSYYRKDAEDRIFSTCPGIKDIYDQLQITTGLSDQVIQKIMEIEMDLERFIIVRREKMIELLEYALDSGKYVYLITDSHLSSDILDELFNNMGISGYHGIYSSCDYGKSKANDLYEVFRSHIGERNWLHIGSNAELDGLNARHYGATTFVVKTAYDMLLLSSYRVIKDEAQSINERSMVGLLISRAFNNPFCLADTKGRPKVSQVQDVGYQFIGGIIVHFVLWLIEEIQRGEYDNVLFSARDGYLIQKLYNMIRHELGHKDLPKGIYFLTSRNSCTGAGLTNREDIKWLAKMPFAESPEDMLLKKFNLTTEEILPYNENRYSSVTEYILDHTDIILQRSSEVKEQYLTYIRGLGLSENKKYAFFDLVSTGTILYYMRQMFNADFIGMYLGYYRSDQAKEGLPIKSYIAMDDRYTMNCYSYLISNYMFLETFITSYGKSLIRFNEQNAVFKEEMRGNDELQFIREMQQSIWDYAKDYISLLHCPGELIRQRFTDKILSFRSHQFTDERITVLENLTLYEDLGLGRIPIGRA